jgi:hypothetical protein
MSDPSCAVLFARRSLREGGAAVTDAKLGLPGRLERRAVPPAALVAEGRTLTMVRGRAAARAPALPAHCRFLAPGVHR